VPASGVDGEPTTLEYVESSAPQVMPPPVSVRIPRARVFRHRPPTPYPLDRIPLAFRVRSPPADRSGGGSTSNSDLEGLGDSASEGIAGAFGRGSSGGSSLLLRSSREIPWV